MLLYNVDMDLPPLPEKPLIPKLGKIEKNIRVYFFEREDGSTFFAQAKEAWTIMKGRVQHVGYERPRIKFIGSSDGSKFRQGVIEAQNIFKEQGLIPSQERIRLAEKEELECARGNMIYPVNQDEMTRGGQLINIGSLR